MDTKTIGYWLSEKKRQKMNWSEFRTVCKKQGYDLVKLDLLKPLDDQGPFSLILHKLTGILVQANKGDPKAQAMVSEVERYLTQHPEVAIIDPLENVRKLLDRCRTYSLMRDLTQRDVFTPNFAELTSDDPAENIAALRRAGVRYPFVCKPSVAQGPSEAHSMAIIFNEGGVRDCQPPSVAQTFVNHNAVLYKIYCVGDRSVVIERPSLKNFYTKDLAGDTILFSSLDISKSDSKSSLTVMDEDDPQRCGSPAPQVDYARLKSIADVVRREVGLHLVGVDVVVENHTNHYAIIDVNAFPGYDGFPDLFDVLGECVVETIQKHGSRQRAQLSLELDSAKGSQNTSSAETSPPQDQDDSGFDTSDSSDERKKHLNGKCRPR